MIIYGVRFEGKLIYVGQSKLSLSKRMQNYRRAIRDLNKKTYIINHLRKHTIDSHEFYVIEYISNPELLNEREIFHIKISNTLYPNGLNLTQGGYSPVFSEHTRNKMSRSRMGKSPWNKDTKGLMGPHWAKGLKFKPQSAESNSKRARFGNDNHFYGRAHSEESRGKMSSKLKGRSVWNKKDCTLMRISSDGETVLETYASKFEAFKQGYDQRCVNRCIARPNLKHKGFYFRELK